MTNVSISRGLAIALFTLSARCRAVSFLDKTGTDEEPAPSVIAGAELLGSKVMDRTAWPQKTKQFALVISATGMDSHFGSGVRQMAFSMDLKGCGLGVDTLTERAQDTADWSTAPAMGLISSSTNFNVGVGGKRSGMTAIRAKNLMHRYDHIYLFGWAWETEYATTLETALEALELDPNLRSRTTLVLDDNPFHRCYAEHALDYCRERAPTMLRRWLNVSSRALSISASDALELNRLKATLHIPGPRFETWPMSLEQVDNLFNRSARSQTEWEEESQTYLTMVANDHAENRKFVSELVTGGHLERICNVTQEITGIGSQQMKIYLIGNIARYVKFTFPDQVSRLSSETGCLRFKFDITMKQLEERILPNTAAILNPFLETINSGISVKTFEAVAMGIPIVSSIAGFRGLEKCGARLNDAGLLATNTASGYVDLIRNKLVNPEVSFAFTQMQQSIMRTCVAEQKEEMKDLCSKTA
jgi:hypothetical protein